MSRELAEADFLSIIKQLPNGERNAQLYEETFKRLSDAEMEIIVGRLEAGNFVFPIFVYNMSEIKIDVDEVMKVGSSIGVEFFQHLILTDEITGETYKTPIKYLVLDLPVRRQVQHIVKKMSAGEGKVVAHLTGQPTGVSKSASISFPELTVMDAKGLQNSALELAKVRGGDAKAYDSMVSSITSTGGFSMAPIMDAGSRPKATETLASLLLGMGLKSQGLTGHVQ